MVKYFRLMHLFLEHSELFNYLGLTLPQACLSGGLECRETETGENSAPKGQQLHHPEAVVQVFYQSGGGSQPPL